jgi:ketosteroid isomerase-like protein
MGSTLDVVHAQQQAIQARNWGALEGLYRSEARYTDPEVSLEGSKNIAARAEALEAPFVDARLEITGAIEAGPHVVVEWRYRAMNQERLTLPSGTELPATGRPVDLRGVSVFEFEGDRISSERSYWDSLDLYRQLGLAVEPGLSGSW